jgi:molecular chaperone GrpE
VNGPQDGDKEAGDPFAGLADGYDADDDMMLEALGMKRNTPAAVQAPAPAAAPVGMSSGPVSPDVLSAILAAIPDAVRDAIKDQEISQQSLRAAPQEAVVPSRQTDVSSSHASPEPVEPNEVVEEEEPAVEIAIERKVEQVAVAPKPEPTPEFELAPELAAFMEVPVSEAQDAPRGDDEVGVEIEARPNMTIEEPDPTIAASGKLQGLLGRIRGKPAAEIARGPGPSTQVGRPAGAPLAASQQVKNLKLELETAQAEVEKARKKMAQLQAETVTFRKRLSDQVKGGNVSGREDVFKSIITVFDSIASALASSAEFRDFEKLYSGVEMIERQFHQTLKPLGLTAIDALGQKFDPAQHEAVRMIRTGEAAPGTVVEQIRKGYRASEKLIRPALVIVEAQPAAVSRTVKEEE